MKYRLFILSACCSLSLAVTAQDPIFTQFYHSPVYLNPGLVGCGKNDFRLCYAGRMQWMNLPTPFQYHTLSSDWYSPDYNVSAGLVANHFNEGYIKTTELSAVLAKNFGSDAYNERPWFLNFAMQFGVSFKHADRNKFLFADQLTQNGQNGLQSQVEIFDTYDKINRAYFDISSGLIFTYGNIMIGGAVHHWSQPHNGLAGSAVDNKLPRRYTVHLSYIREGNSVNDGAIILKPTIIFNTQDKSRSLMLGSLFDLPEQNIEFGLWYRNNWNFSDNHSLGISVNIKFGKEKNYYNGEGNGRYRAGLSYDGEINRPGVRHTSGSSEIGILYEANSESCPKPSGGGYGRFPWEFH